MRVFDVLAILDVSGRFKVAVQLWLLKYPPSLSVTQARAASYDTLLLILSCVCRRLLAVS